MHIGESIAIHDGDVAIQMFDSQLKISDRNSRQDSACIKIFGPSSRRWAFKIEETVVRKVSHRWGPLLLAKASNVGGTQILKTYSMILGLVSDQFKILLYIFQPLIKAKHFMLLFVSRKLQEYFEWE
mgnify:FL=1